MPVSHKGSISMGLVNIPVALYTATQDDDVHFNQLCPDGGRVRYKKICESTGEEVDNKHIQKGYQYEDDQFVVISDEEFEKIKTDKDKSLQILHFCDVASIPTIYYDKAYHAVPQAGGEKAYELLYQILKQEKKVAIAKTIMKTKETLLMIMAGEDGILAQTMFFENEVREMPKDFEHPKISDAELKMGNMLVAQMEKPFEPKEHQNTYNERLRELIALKIAGKEVVAAKSEKRANVIDLMDALKASVEKKPVKKASKKRKGA